MAPHAGTAGLKVLLAGQSQEDLNGAQTFLAGEGAIVTTSFVKADLATLLQSDAFDVAVVEVEAEAQAAAQSNSLQFLTASSLPTVVALDAQDAASMVIAVELGAVDIFQKPVSSQTGRLGTLWQHTLRKRSSAASPARKPDSCNTSSGAGSTAAEPTVCTAGDDLVKAILPDLFEADLWDEQTITGTSGEHGSSIDTPETPDISHHLRQDYSSSQTLLSNYPNDFSTVHSGSSPSHEQAHSVNSALSPVLVPQVVSTECETSSFELQPTFSECLEYAEGDPSEDSRQSKKQKVEWTRELHDKFVSAVEALSVDKAVPSKILERMGTCSEGLTRQNIASHLQKYRNRKRSRQGQNFAAPFKSSSSAHLPLLLPAPAMTSWGPPQPACWTPHPSQTPGQCGAPYNWAQAAPPTAGPFNPNIALTISEMLSQPQGPPPLGLKLDTAAVLAQMSNTRLIQA